MTDLSLTRDADSQTQRQLADASAKTKDQFIDVGLQTEGHKRRKLARVPETYLRDGKTVLATQKKEHWFLRKVCPLLTEIHEEENWF